MAQKAHDQAGLHAELSPGVADGAVETVDHRRERNAAGRVPLRIEEHLDMPDIVGVRTFEIGPGKVVEILLRDQHGHALIVEVEKILQVSEPIGLTQSVHRRILQPDAVAARQREHQLRLQASLDMNVQFALGEPFDQGVQVGHSVASLSGVKWRYPPSGEPPDARSISRGGRWRSLGKTASKHACGSGENRSPDQQGTLAVDAHCEEKLHGNSHRARRGPCSRSADAPVSIWVMSTSTPRPGRSRAPR